MILASILKLARQQHQFYSSPRRTALILWELTTNAFRQIEIFRLLARPGLANLVQVNPIFPFKYLTQGYLARGLNASRRASCFAHHYGHLYRDFPAPVLGQILTSGITVYRTWLGGDVFSITLGAPTDCDREGELSLKFLVDGAPVFILQFTVVPGPVIGTEASSVLLISRLQGVKGCYKQVYRATKAMNEVAPAALLVAALVGFAEVCGVGEIAGVSAAGQFCYHEEYAAVFKSAYDDFFLTLGASLTARGFYHSPIPLPEKPLALVTNGHKRRTKAKRAFKQRITDEVARMLRETCVEAAQESQVYTTLEKSEMRAHGKTARTEAPPLPLPQQQR